MRGNGIFSLLLLCSVLFIVRLKAQTMHLCPDQVEDSTCKIVCITPDHTQTVAYFKLPNTGTHIAQCVPSVGCFSNQIGYTITQPNATSTVLQFVLKRSLIGTYRCDYGSDTANDTLHWGTYPSDALVTGVTNGSEIASVDEFSVSLNCFYSQEDPTIILHYKDEQGNIDATSDLFSCTNSTNSSCPHDDAFTSYDCPCRLRHKTGIDCKDTYEVNGYITISNIDSMWNSRIVDEITFPCQSTDFCDFSYWTCLRNILAAVFSASDGSSILVWLRWIYRKKMNKDRSILLWLAGHWSCSCAQKIKSFCEKNAKDHYWGRPKLLLVDVFVIGIVVGYVAWLISMLYFICKYCACKESHEKWIVFGISVFSPLLASLLGTSLVFIMFCSKDNDLDGGIFDDEQEHANCGEDFELFKQKLKPDIKIQSITYTHNGNVVSSANTLCEGGTRECPWLTLQTVSLDQCGEYVCKINYGPSQQKVHHQNLLVTRKQYEVQVGDKIVLLSGLRDLKHIISSVEWIHDAKVVPTNRYCYDGGNIKKPPLTIKYCSASDSGTYVCTIGNQITLTPKRFSVQLIIKDDIKVDVGGKIILLKNLNMKNIKDVQWNHKQKPIPHDWGCFYDAENRTCPALTISLVAACMAGTYQCIVESTKDPEIKVFEVRLNVIDQYTVDSGDSINIFKDLSSYHGIKKISWELNGDPLELTGNPSYMGGTKDCPQLTVCFATTVESGKYTCTLEFQSQPTKVLNFKLDVNEQWQVDSGESIVLLDKLSSTNVESVAWAHTERPLNCLHEGGTVKSPALTIPVVSLEDSGEYECRIKLQQGNVRLYRFVVKVNVQEIKKKVGERVILLQNLKSAGKIQEIDWYKNGRKVDTDKYQGGIDKSPGLIVGPLGQDDSGRYQCDIIVKESQIKLHIPVDLTVEQKKNCTRLGPVFRHKRVHTSTENIKSWTEEEK